MGIGRRRSNGEVGKYSGRGSGYRTRQDSGQEGGRIASRKGEGSR
jgi:hypothetical protein